MELRKIDKILVATDGSQESMDAAMYASELVRRMRLQVTLVHVAPSPAIPVAGTTQLTAADEVQIERSVWEGAQVILDRTRKPFDQVGLQVEGVIRRGDPAQEILAMVREEGFDLIVISNHGVGRAGLANLGSTSDALVRFAPCPVLVVRRGTTEE